MNKRQRKKAARKAEEAREASWKATAGPPLTFEIIDAGITRAMAHVFKYGLGAEIPIHPEVFDRLCKEGKA